MQPRWFQVDAAVRGFESVQIQACRVQGERAGSLLSSNKTPRASLSLAGECHGSIQHAYFSSQTAATTLCRAEIRLARRSRSIPASLAGFHRGEQTTQGVVPPTLYPFIECDAELVLWRSFLRDTVSARLVLDCPPTIFTAMNQVFVG